MNYYEKYLKHKTKYIDFKKHVVTAVIIMKIWRLLKYIIVKNSFAL